MSLEEENKLLRKLLWLKHGHHISQLYGDDGEMQCAHCLREYGFYDYLRTPAKEIYKKLINNISNTA